MSSSAHWRRVSPMLCSKSTCLPYIHMEEQKRFDRLYTAIDDAFERRDMQQVRSNVSIDRRHKHQCLERRTK
ncbi:hypothetical protein M3J09_009436 [Ascochyta lentis]